MAKLINIDKTNFIDANIERYASDKISQYSRYLDQSHIFCTYYPINKIMSRVDKGLGNTYSYHGSNSSLRYNKVKNLPLFNVPELKPELEYDENGTDINLDISGVTLLPNTIKPNAGDYVLITLPGAKEFLFIVKSFEYNTIQSNDYYQISLEIKDVGTNLEKKKFDGLIVDAFETIYENIGTEDNCFIRTEDITKLEAIVSLITEIKDMYMNNYWDDKLGCFTVKYYDGLNYFYDFILSMFIMKSEIFYEVDNPKTIMLVNLDNGENSEKLFNRTIFYSVLNGNTDYLSKDLYYYTRNIYSSSSIFNIYNYPCHTIELVMLKYVSKNNGFKEYFSHELIECIIDPENHPFDRIYEKEPIEPIEIKPLPYPKILERDERMIPDVEYKLASDNINDDNISVDGDTEENTGTESGDNGITDGEIDDNNETESGDNEIVDGDSDENTNGNDSNIVTESTGTLLNVTRTVATDSENNSITDEDVIENETEYTEPKPLYIPTSNDNMDVESLVLESEPEPKPVTIYDKPIECNDIEKEITWRYKDVDYLELILYNYLINNDQEIDRKKLVPYLVNNDLHSYYYLPIIIFILKKKYDKYFIKTEY